MSAGWIFSTIIFCILNIWIIISWHEWQYGASYSTRALTQSYPVFALAFAAVIERFIQSKIRWGLALVGVYLIFVNLFQTWRYNSGILHHSNMNAAYYRAIYLDANPTAEDYALMGDEGSPAD